MNEQCLYLRTELSIWLVIHDYVIIIKTIEMLEHFFYKYFRKT